MINAITKSSKERKPRQNKIEPKEKRKSRGRSHGKKDNKRKEDSSSETEEEDCLPWTDDHEDGGDSYIHCNYLMYDSPSTDGWSMCKEFSHDSYSGFNLMVKMVLFTT